ncbi:Replicative DNA helicase [Frankia canadensis]|uniref:Replicative DNA helicase n=1 Tax=Frankia canadensis TaxID=1836972 RepID=A0A2I2KXY8_9ACTN|nr:replicative DNA helicase [Frankia canadensis]SNQ50520.1 Replicative DNA helicase [Frankia canadensis]SOU57810.1 Replicative DNA helicase [Frankia canadensis]
MSVTEISRGVGGAEEFDRTPPHDLPAEQSVLGGMLLSKDAIADVVEVLRMVDFYRPAHGLIFEVIGDLYGRGEPADVISAAAELGRRDALERVGGAGYLHTLISSVPTAANAGYYAHIVAEKAILRRLAEAGTRIVQLAYGAAPDVSEVVDRAQAAVYDVTERRTNDDYAPLGDLLNPALEEIESIEGHDGALTGVPTGFTDLDELTNGLHGGQLWIVAARPAVGKALALDTPLATPTGWTTMGRVAVGDRLIGADGQPTRVVAATEVMVGRPCYEVEFSDGSVLVADAQHQWVTETRADRRVAAGRTSCPGTAAGGRPVTTEEIARTLHCSTADRRHNHAVRVARPFALPTVNLPIDPYLLGAWLGDGTSSCAQLTSADPDIPAEIRSRGYDVVASATVKYRYSLRLRQTAVEERSCMVCGRTFANRMPHVRTCGQSCGGKLRFLAKPLPARTCVGCGGRVTSYGPRCGSCHAESGTLQTQLRTLGVLGDKHIPLQYLRADEQQRRDLLAGLLDTDGTVASNGTTVQFAVTNERLARDTHELILSLGYRASVTTKRVQGASAASSTCYMINFAPQEQVFRLTRKADRLRPTGHPTVGLRYITAVRPIASVPVRCVEVDNADHLYLAGISCIPTHNSTLGLDFARAASIKNGMTSVIFSLEMSRMEITMRLLSAEARVSLQNIRTGRLSEDDWSRLTRRMGEVAEAPLFIDDSPHLTMMEIRAKARRLKQRNQLRLVILDYLQLMSSPKKVESRQQEVSEISRSLKLLAKELEVPVVAISQLNRASEQRADKRPQVSDLRESGSLEQDADAVILLYREDAVEKESARAGEADLIIAKHRNGPTGTVTVAFQGHYSRFVDMAN